MPDTDLRALQMQFAPNTIEHLGVNMYSQLPPVVAELIANSYDADATEVHIALYDVGSKKIVVTDNGHGMSFDEINQDFLIIGRNRRVKNNTDKSPMGRPVIGKKGLGKLAFFGVSHEIQVTTVKNGLKNSFVMDWDKITGMANDKGEFKNYEPDILARDETTTDRSGTTITLTKIQRETEFKPDDLMDRIAMYFILPDNFVVKVSHNNDKPVEIDNMRRYSVISTKKEVEWDVPTDIGLESDYEYAGNISGHVLTTEKPIPPKSGMRGVALFSRKKLVNLPEHFSDSTSSHFFSYLTGWLEVDFIDDLEEDVIVTDRQSLKWDHPKTQELREHLRKILGWLEKDWRAKRQAAREKRIGSELKKDHGISISEWQANVPDDIKQDLLPVIEKLAKDSELPSDQITGTVKRLWKLIPPYTRYHYRYLHSTLSDTVMTYYKNEDYYGAVFEGVKRYIREVQAKTGSTLTDRALLESIFAIKNASWSVVNKYKRPNNKDFEDQIYDDITKGHQKLVIAMWEAFRNPISHDPVEDLRDSGLYTERDCLDALGLLSHLFRRLDDLERI